MSLKLNQMPDTDIAPQVDTTPAGMENPPKKKRTRRTRLEIAQEKQAAGKELSDKDKAALEKHHRAQDVYHSQIEEKENVQQSIQLQESQTHEDGAGSGSNEPSDVPPWEDTKDSTPVEQPESSTTVSDTVGTGRVGQAAEEGVTPQHKLEDVGNLWNLGGKVHQLIFENSDFKIFLKVKE